MPIYGFNTRIPVACRPFLPQKKSAHLGGKVVAQLGTASAAAAGRALAG